MNQILCNYIQKLYIIINYIVKNIIRFKTVLTQSNKYRKKISMNQTIKKLKIRCKIINLRKIIKNTINNKLYVSGFLQYYFVI